MAPVKRPPHNLFPCKQKRTVQNQVQIQIPHHFCFLMIVISIIALAINPFNAEATFVQSTQTLKPLKTMPTLSCWYSLESPHRVLSDEYPFARVSVIFHVFFHHLVLAKLATSSIRVKPYFNKLPHVYFSYLSKSWPPLRKGHPKFLRLPILGTQFLIPV